MGQHTYANLAVMGWVALGVMVAFFGVIEFRLLRDHARLAPIRKAVRQEAVAYRAAIFPQWGRGWWGRGNAQGMQLVVREHSFELSYPFQGGRFLTTEWYCWGRDARMKMGEGRFPPPRVKRDCIVLTIPSIDDASSEQEILLSSWQHELHGAWGALLACGVHAAGDPPPVGR
jgi:hypothetical protein